MPLVVLHKQEGCRWVQVWGEPRNNLSPTSHVTLVPSRPWSVQQSDGVFPVITSVGAKLAHLLLRSPCLPVAFVNCSQKLPSPLISQPSLLKNAFWLGYIQNGATLSPSVTFYTARYAE